MKHLSTFLLTCSICFFISASLFAGGTIPSRTYTASGPGNAVSFDGIDDDVKIPASASINTQTSITLEAWVYPQGSDLQPILVYDNGSLTGVAMWQLDSFDKLYANFKDNTGTNHTLYSSSNAISVSDRWYHVAAVYDGVSGTGYVYVNGVQVGTANLGIFTLQTSYDLYIGGALTQEQPVNNYLGLIDETRIWNIALSADSIVSHMKHRLAGDEAGLVAYYRCDEESGNTLTDATTNHNDGTLQNGTARTASTAPIDFVSITGNVFNDMNGNAGKDGGDTGLQNWKIRLSGDRSDSVLSDVSGNYTITDVLPGNYTVSQELQDGWAQTLPHTSNYTFSIITGGLVFSGKDFGNYKKSTITGQSFKDVNNDGIKNGNDAGLPNWSIFLVTSTQETLETFTDASGFFSIQNIEPGAYTLYEEQREGWSQSIPQDPAVYPLQIVSGDSLVNKNFGNHPLPSTITGKVYRDMNNDSTIQDSEWGIPNWKIALAGSVTETTATDENGVYTFSNLASGNYTVTQVPKSGWIKKIPTSANYAVALGDGKTSTKNFLDIYKTDTASYRTFTRDSISVAPIKVTKKNSSTYIPNGANVRDSSFTRRVSTKTGMILGVLQTTKEGQKKYGWVVFSKGKGLGGFLPQTGQTAYKLDSIRYTSDKPVKVKKLLKVLKDPTYKKYNNHLIAEFATLKVNINASDASLTPKGFGSLIFNDSSYSMFRGLSINQVASRIDSAITLLDYNAFSSITAAQIDSLCAKINRSFASGAITGTDIFFRSPLILYGVRKPYETHVIIGNTAKQEVIQPDFASVANPVPEKISIGNYPNPFNPSTVIYFNLPNDGMVTLKVYDVLGKEVATITNNQQMESGYNEMQFDASRLSSGMYFYRLTARDENGGTQNVTTGKMMLLK